MTYDKEKKDLYWQISGLEHELKQYKDIEEELGISLVVYFKLFKCSHVWAYSNSGKIEANLTGINTWSKTITLWNGTCSITYPFSQYEKSWALTKEELL